MAIAVLAAIVSPKAYGAPVPPPGVTLAGLGVAAPAPQARSATKSAIAERTRSGTLYQRQSAADALATLKAKLPEVVLAPSLHTLKDLPASASVLGYSDVDRAATVKLADGARLLLSSTTALRTVDDDTGLLAPIDLSLTPGQEGFEAVNSPTPVTFPASLVDGVQVGDFAVTIPGAQGSAAAPVADSVVWPNALADTDVVARAVPSGVQISLTLRSTASPADIPVAVGVPAGSSMRLANAGGQGVGGLEIVDGAGKVAGTVSAPIAWDADHVAVPTSWRMDGSTPVLHVDFAGADVAWPIAVDPTINDERYGGVLSARPWAYQPAPPSPVVQRDPATADYGWGPGLYQILPYAYYYGQGLASWWYLDMSSRPTAGIRQVTAQGMNHDTGANAAGGPETCTFVDLAVGGTPTNSGNTWCDSYRNRATNAGNWTIPNYMGNQARVGMYTNGPGQRGYFQQSIGTLVVAIADDTAPTSTSVSPGSATWNATTAVSATSYDSGVGIDHIDISADGIANSTTALRGVCPTNGLCNASGVSGSVAVNGRGDGIFTIRARAYDVAGNANASDATTQVKFDRAAPLIGPLTGMLYDDRATAFTGTRAIRVPLSGEGSTATLSQRRSGVKQMRLVVDKGLSSMVVADQKSFPQQDSFVPSAASDANVLRINASALTPGTHTVTVEVSDWANNPSPSSPFTITVAAAQTAPGFRPGTTLISSSGGIVNPNSLWTSGVVAVDTFRGRLLAHETDGTVAPDEDGDLAWPVDRWYDSGAKVLQRDLSPGWTTGVGTNVQLEFAAGGVITYVAPSQARYMFTPQAGGTYALQVVTDDDDAELVKRPGGGYDVTVNNTGRVLHFDADGRLTSADDDAGNKAYYTYASTDRYWRMVTASDGNGHIWRFSHTNGVLQSVTDPSNLVGTYTYSGGRLTASRTPDGFVRTYGYDASGRLSSLTNPSRTVNVHYRADGRVDSFGEGTSLLTLTYPAVSPAICGSVATSQTNITWPSGALQIQCFDAAGNMLSRHFPDTLIPTLVSPGVKALYDTSTSKTLVQWNDATDPQLPDGSPGSGVLSYSVRVQRDGGAWSAWTAVQASQILLTGGRVGESIAVQVNYADQAGNPGAMASGTVASTAFNTADGAISCQPTEVGYSGSCTDPSVDSAEDEVETDTSVSVVDTGSQGGVGTLAATPDCALNGVCRLSVSHSGWAVLRNRPQEYAIGNAHDGWLFNVARSVRADSPTKGQPGIYSGGYVQGGPGFNVCGFIKTSASTTGTGTVYGPLTTSCPPGFGVGTDTQNPDFRSGPKVVSWAAGINCQNLPNNADGRNCADGYLVHLIRPATAYRNLSPYPLVPSPSRRGIHPAKQLKTGAAVRWRYTTSDRNWVMVRVGTRQHGRTNWFFVSRSSLPPLCVNRKCKPVDVP